MAVILLSKSKYKEDPSYHYYICMYSSDMMTTFDVLLDNQPDSYYDLKAIYRYLSSVKSFGSNINFYIHNYNISEIDDISSSNCDNLMNEFPIKVFLNMLNNVIDNTTDHKLDDDGDISDNDVIYDIIKTRVKSHIYNNLL